MCVLFLWLSQKKARRLKGNWVYKKIRTIHVLSQKKARSWKGVLTVQLICFFVFAYKCKIDHHAMCDRNVIQNAT